MSKDKPILTLNFSKDNNAGKLREQMQQRLKQLGIVSPTKKDENDKTNNKVNVNAGNTDTSGPIKRVNRQLNEQPAKTAAGLNKTEQTKTDFASTRETSSRKVKVNSNNSIKSVELTQITNGQQKSLGINTKTEDLSEIHSHDEIINNDICETGSKISAKSNGSEEGNNIDIEIKSFREKPKVRLLMQPKKVEKLLQYLRDIYPKCFTIPISPLALRIHRQLWESELNKEDGLLRNKSIIRNILQVYARGRKYRQSLVLGVPRLNLDGTSCSNVTEAELPINYRKKSFENLNTKTNDINAPDNSSNSNNNNVVDIIENNSDDKTKVG